MTTNGSGSKFMDNIYKAKATCQKIDKESGDPQAPGTFSNDKWNPGDIWMTSLQSPASQKPFENFKDIGIHGSIVISCTLLISFFSLSLNFK